MKWARTLCFNVKVECCTVNLDCVKFHRFEVGWTYCEAQGIYEVSVQGKKLKSTQCSVGKDTEEQSP